MIDPNDSAAAFGAHKANSAVAAAATAVFRQVPSQFACQEVCKVACQALDNVLFKVTCQQCDLSFNLIDSVVRAHGKKCRRKYRHMYQRVDTLKLKSTLTSMS